MLDIRLQQKQADLAANCLLRRQEEVETSDGIYFYANGKRYLSFSTNNYLALSHHPKVKEASLAAIQKYGVGSGAAYLVSGYTPLHKQLEEELANFLDYPRVLLFSSGYLANIGVIRALFSKQDSIFGDKLNHASLMDGCQASNAIYKRYPHVKMNSLENLCKQPAAGNKLIVTEGVFGMDGTVAPLSEICAIADKYNACVMVDDAHGMGVIGDQGKGSIEYQNVDNNKITLLTGTLGKAFGSYGAFVASSDLIIESLIQSARTYIYTTAIPPAIAAASLASLKIIKEEKWRRTYLQELVSYFKRSLQELDIPHLNSDTPIQPIIIGDNQQALTVSQALLDRGLFIKAIRPPTVPAASARLRITLTAAHTKQQLDFLLEALTDAIKPA